MTDRDDEDLRTDAGDGDPGQADASPSSDDIEVPKWMRSSSVKDTLTGAAQPLSIDDEEEEQQDGASDAETGLSPDAGTSEISQTADQPGTLPGTAQPGNGEKPEDKPGLNVPSMEHGFLQKETSQDAAPEPDHDADTSDTVQEPAGETEKKTARRAAREPQSHERRPRKTVREWFQGLGSIERVVVFGVILLCILLIVAVYKQNQTFSSYDVEASFSNEGDASANYKLEKSGMLRYSNNGIAMLSKNGTELWDQSYEMSSPILADSDDYYAVGDRGANSIYVFNAAGQCGTITTDVPIQDLKISNQGILAAILSDTEGNYVNLYDHTGSLLVNIRATLEETGYPEALAISPDGSRLAVSYLKVSSGSVQTNLIFYDFGGSSSDSVIYTETVDELCPRIEFISDARAVVFRETGCAIYSVGSTEVKQAQQLKFEDNIRSIFLSSQKIGFVLDNSDDQGKYRIELYDTSGRLNKTIYTDLEYTQMSWDDDDIILYTGSRAQIFSYNGRKKFDGEFDETVSAMMPSWQSGMYWIVRSSGLEEIRIR